MGLPLRALEAGSPGYVVQQRRRAQGLHSHPGGAACTARTYLCTYLCTCMSRAVPLAEKLAGRAMPRPRRPGARAVKANR